MNAREIISLLIQLVSGAVCANIIGSFFDQSDLGVPGNSLAGIVGAGLGGKLLVLLLGGSGSHAGTRNSLFSLLLDATPTHSGNFLSSILVLLVGGSLGGAIVMLLVGLGRQSLSD